MRKKVAVAVILGLVCVMAAHAAGKKDNESYEAENPDGFTSSIDISNRKPGKYNFYIEARDKANNRTLAGPENIWIDPVSDLPIANIINPKPDMHVRGNLNIVGSCYDDDGVGHVELTVARGRPGERGEELVRTRAEGKEFWSYFLDTADGEIWTDGVYTLTAWGVDINGLSGISENFSARDRKFQQVVWHLDRKKPETRVSSHEVGALVTGKITLRGVVSDGNGVKSLGYSLDGGDTYRNLPIKYDQRYDAYQWSLGIDTRAMEDGARVIWFKAYDGMETVGLAAHLLFVNNTGPDVQITHPGAGATVSGIFSAAGYASHPVGLQSLTWKLGRESGEIPLVTGNSWWVQEFDVRGAKGNSVDLEIRAVDLSGNATVAKRKMKIDQRLTLPRVALQEPRGGSVTYDDVLNIKGIATDNDAVASVLYSIDGGEAREIPCAGYFQFSVSGISAGTHSLEVWAKDIHGIEGPKVQAKGIIVPGPLPEPRIESVRAGGAGAAAEFYTGMDLSQDGTVMGFAVASAFPVASFRVNIAGGGEVPVAVRADKDGMFRGEIAVPYGLSGLVKIDLRAADRFGREGAWSDYAYGKAPWASSFEWVRADMAEPEAETGDDTPRLLITSPDASITGLAGFKAVSAALSGSGAENFRASVDSAGRVQLQAGGEGAFGPLTLQASGSGQSLSYVFNALVDFSGPAFEIESCPEWARDAVPLRLSVYSPNRVNLAYSADLGQSWAPLMGYGELAGSAPGSVFERDMDISFLPDGAHDIQIMAIGEANHRVVRNVFVRKDTEAPQAALIVPAGGASVNGAVCLGVEVKEAGVLKSVTYRRPASEDGGRPAITREIYPGRISDDPRPPRFLGILTDPAEMPLDEKMTLAFEDMAGNRSELGEWPFIIDNEADIPVVQIILPLDNEIITSDFEVSGVMFDDDAIGKVYWRIDDNPDQEIEAEGGNVFSVYVRLGALTDNEHSVTITAEDIYGVRSAPVTRSFRVSLSEPMASVTTPFFDMIVGGMIEMSGGSYDENGIAKVEVSLDNGLSFNTARINAQGSTAEWFYEFDSQIMKDGPNVIFISVEDNYGISALYSGLLNLDNTPPEVTLDSPANGMTTTGPVSILGQVSDLNLEGKEIRLRSLDGHSIPEGQFSIYRAGPSPILKEYMDLSGLPDGMYNLEFQAVDKADNVTIVSRNFEIDRASRRNFVNVLYPLNGDHLQGNFNLYGNTGGVDEPCVVGVQVNGADVASAEVTWTGYWSLSLGEGHMRPGLNSIVVACLFGGEKIVETREIVDKKGNVTYVSEVTGYSGGETVLSEAREVFYQPHGAWLTVDSMIMGDFAFNRPWLVGRAGYVLNEEDEFILTDKNADRAEQNNVKGKALSHVDISFDNGNTFFRAGSSPDDNADWRYRLETGDMAEGFHYIIVRANMRNGETAITRTVLQVDKTAPQIRLITPQAGGRYNNGLEFSALASDDVALASLSYHLRIGDKFFYEVPPFLQGLYFEATIPPFVRLIAPEAPVVFAGGATFMDAGMGLSFFDDNVKIQAQYGFLTQDLFEKLGGEGDVRYGGHVLGLKVLANIYNLPFGAAVGPDWEWLSMTFAVGANFSLFDLAREGYTQSGNPTWMGALVGQIEFPKVTIPNRENFRTFGVFTEGQLWFVPTDVDAKDFGIRVVIPHLIVGLRLYIF